MRLGLVERMTHTHTHTTKTQKSLDLKSPKNFKQTLPRSQHVFQNYALMLRYAPSRMRGFYTHASIQ